MPQQKLIIVPVTLHAESENTSATNPAEPLKNFSLTINKELSERLNAINNEYKMSKNVLFGIIISDYFESNMDEVLLHEDDDSKDKDDLEPKA